MVRAFLLISEQRESSHGVWFNLHPFGQHSTESSAQLTGEMMRVSKKLSQALVALGSIARDEAKDPHFPTVITAV